MPLPVADHEDVHPSCKAYGSRWRCFACGAGGSIYDLGSAVYGYRTTGSDFLELRKRIAAELIVPEGFVSDVLREIAADGLAHLSVATSNGNGVGLEGVADAEQNIDAFATEIRDFVADKRDAPLPLIAPPTIACCPPTGSG